MFNWPVLKQSYCLCKQCSSIDMLFFWHSRNLERWVTIVWLMFLFCLFSTPSCCAPCSILITGSVEASSTGEGATQTWLYCLLVFFSSCHWLSECDCWVPAGLPDQKLIRWTSGPRWLGPRIVKSTTVIWTSLRICLFYFFNNNWLLSIGFMVSLTVLILFRVFSVN